jgi:hypothetical protein
MSVPYSVGVVEKLDLFEQGVFAVGKPDLFECANLLSRRYF